MNEIATILSSAGYQITKNINVTPTEETLYSLSVYCIGMMLPFETKKIKNILKNYNVSVTPYANLEIIDVTLKTPNNGNDGANDTILTIPWG